MVVVRSIDVFRLWTSWSIYPEARSAIIQAQLPVIQLAVTFFAFLA